MSNKYIAVIPAYNPPEAILTVIEQLTSLCFEIIVVNDGSDADYKDMFRECQKTSKVISHIQNKGKGCSLAIRIYESILSYPRFSGYAQPLSC